MVQTHSEQRWISYSISPSLGFFTCKLGIIIAPISYHRGLGQLNYLINILFPKPVLQAAPGQVPALWRWPSESPEEHLPSVQAHNPPQDMSQVLVSSQAHLWR